MYYAVVEVRDPFADIPLLPGLFVEAVIQGKELSQVSVLPRSSLFERDKILTLDAENKVVIQSVKVLRKTDDQVWIQSTIPDDTLVTTEKQSLTPTGTVVDPVFDEAQEEGVEISALEENEEKVNERSN
jgi:hypothetical protein